MSATSRRVSRMIDRVSDYGHGGRHEPDTASRDPAAAPAEPQHERLEPPDLGLLLGVTSGLLAQLRQDGRHQGDLHVVIVLVLPRAEPHARVPGSRAQPSARRRPGPSGCSCPNPSRRARRQSAAAGAARSAQRPEPSARMSNPSRSTSVSLSGHIQQPPPRSVEPSVLSCSMHPPGAWNMRPYTRWVHDTLRSSRWRSGSLIRRQRRCAAAWSGCRRAGVRRGDSRSGADCSR